MSAGPHMSVVRADCHPIRRASKAAAEACHLSMQWTLHIVDGMRMVMFIRPAKPRFSQAETHCESVSA